MNIRYNFLRTLADIRPYLFHRVQGQGFPRLPTSDLAPHQSHGAIYCALISPSKQEESLDSIYKDIVQKSMVNNTRNNLFGFIAMKKLHNETGLVMQYIEGHPNTLYRTMMKIEHDERLKAMTTIACGKTSKIHFPNFCMQDASEFVVLDDIINHHALIECYQCSGMSLDSQIRKLDVN